MMEDRQKRHKTQAKGPMGGGPAMGRPVEKAKDFKGTMKRLITYLRPRRVSLIVVFIFAILSTVFSIVSPKVMGKATTKLFEGIMGKMALEKLLPQLDTLTKLSKNPATATPDVANSISAVNKKISEIMSLNGGKIDFDYIAHIVFILIGLYAISAIFAYVQQYVMAGVAQKTVFNMRKDVDEKLSRLPLKYFDSHTHGEILSRVTNDIDTVSSTLQQSLTQLITSVVTIIGIIVMMLTISPILTLVTIVTLPLSIFVTTNIAKRSQKYFADQQNALGRLNGHVEEMYTGHKIVKAFGHEQISIGEFDDINEELYNVGWKAQFISGIIMPLMNFINNIGYVLVCVVGGIFVTKGRINLGDIQAFIQYSRQFGQPIVQTANIVNILQSTVAAAERVFEVLDEVEEIQDADITQVIESPKGEVKFENVNFGYEKDAMLIENMNIDVKPGQTIAIVGPTGAGKTTIVNLLMRFYEIDEGKITIDGIDIRDLKRGNLRNIFGMVLQDTWLFNGTIRDNIGYGRLGATEDEIILAAKAAHADHFIRTLPEGYDTILNEEASNISQGQKQLLTIARAILLDPSVLILDEATSSVDTRTEIYIQKAMTKLMQGRTSFVIAHRLSTIRGADLILVMNNGSIIEKGSHEELLEDNGFYADLYNSQFKGARLEEEAI
ncbi:ABC transporter ATP-binding protein [Clostridium algidicarnis]|uniref:ATP-binding cassette subfamily B protein n=1 Tax=Clostridium algidicarnis DSM 15099 TaxID=1121295 RepID=A0A2S6FVL1_9CLOT|nr:ABC transporter ATP-binding protein [Clostridium algidicarnis]PPK45595.1 ATP-binding cassette subfamily B protein [Clostridium algidicarnis DSM 15099]